MVTTDVILLLAFFVITLIVMLGMARELNITRRSQQESAALLRRLVESMAPGAAKDVPITTEEEPQGLRIPSPKAAEPKSDDAKS